MLVLSFDHIRYLASKSPRLQAVLHCFRMMARILHLNLCVTILLLLQSVLASPACHEQDLKALLDFKAAVDDTSGRLGSWQGDDCCSWAAVTCNEQTGRVVSLKLSGLSDNPDSSTVGIGIGNHVVSGTISESLGKLSSLEVLALNNLALSGSIPESLGSIPSLKAILLDGNSLTGAIPDSICSLQHLEQLYLRKNKLTGTIPARLGSLKHLRELVLESNRLSGAIPTSLQGLRSLEKLDISNNQLTGQLPASIGYLPKLKKLSLFRNSITGTIPQTFGYLASLEELDLTNNLLSGSLPKSLSQCRSLKSISLSTNQLDSSIPFSWGGLASLSLLDLSSNRLTGTIPSSFSALSNLQVLDVAHNQLYGRIPDLSKSSQLNTLDLSYNHFVLYTLPTWLKSLTGNSFNKLSFASCGLVSLPDFASDLNVGYLDLSMNRLTGDIPDLTSSSRQLTHLNLSYNPLAIKLSSKLTEFPSLQVLDMRSTMLEGPVSPIFSVGLISSLEYADLSSNFLSGKLPSLATPMFPGGNFHSLNLSRNELQGIIPATISNLGAMKNLDLCHNQFPGTIPATLGSMALLEKLDLSFNKLTGSIPLVLLKLGSLKSLDLSSNLLSGFVPQVHNFSAAAFQNNPGLCGEPLPSFHENSGFHSQGFRL